MAFIAEQGWRLSTTTKFEATVALDFALVQGLMDATTFPSKLDIAAAKTLANINIQVNALTREQLNPGLFDFLLNWSTTQLRMGEMGHPALYGPFFPDPYQLGRLRSTPSMDVIRREDLGPRNDIQGIDWWALGISRQMAVDRRSKTVQNYRNSGDELPENVRSSNGVDMRRWH